MNKIVFNKIIIFVLLTFLNAELYQGEIIAKIGDHIIFENDVIERAEYTPRPLYCRGNSILDKKIIINTLIGEKLFSEELNELDIPENIDNYLIGRKNQKMRDVLFFDITNSSSIKTSQYSHWYQLADYEYDIKYLSILDEKLVNKIKNKIAEGIDLDSIYLNEGVSEKKLPIRQEIRIFNLDNYALRESLYEKVRYVGDIVGPIKTDDNVYMFYEIINSKKTINLSPNQQKITADEISELITKQSNEIFFRNYVENIMKGLSFKLNEDGFRYFSEYVKSWYERDKTVNLNLSYDNLEENVSNKVLLSLDDNPITINKILNWIKIHPLEFRNGYYEKMVFEIQLKYALADLIRDRKLNEEAKRIGLDRHPLVLREYEKWRDNYQAMKIRNDIIGNIKLNSIDVPIELNNFFKNLTSKYSDKIWINTKAVERLELSSIDMVVLNETGPYEINTPIFPIITSHHQFDYGKVLD